LLGLFLIVLQLIYSFSSGTGGKVMSKPNKALEVIEMFDKSGPESYMNPLAQYDQLEDKLRHVIDADKLPVQKIYHVDEAGYGATFYMVDIDDIKAAPRIAYADIVPHGKWVRRFIDGWDTFICSHCNGWPHTAAYMHETFKYCPNCGARMIGEK
jgi:hypothetical protein